jgi:hypothetical protein
MLSGVLFLANQSATSAGPVPGAIALSIGAVLFLSWLIPAVSWGQSLEREKRDRLNSVRVTLQESTSKHAEVTLLISNVNRALVGLAKVEDHVLEAEDMLSDPEISCTLLLIDSASAADEYDEESLVEILQQVARSCANETGPDLPLGHLRQLVRTTPAVFLSDLTIADAERIQAFLSGEFGVTTGIKRKFVPTLELAVSGP